MSVHPAVTDGGNFKQDMSCLEKKSVPIKINKIEYQVVMKKNSRPLRYGMRFEFTTDRNDEMGVTNTRV